MKKTVFRLLSLMLAISPMIATAQSNIKSAFDAIIKCPQAQITESHSMERNPEDNVKIGQSDIYKFILPANKMSLIKNAINAFEKDSQYAYSLKSGHSKKRDPGISIAVGNGEGSGIIISEPDYDYYYELFLAPKSENPDGIYRYAYAINYKETDGHIEGKIVITYATTLKYRQSPKQNNSVVYFNQDDYDSTLENLMYYIGMINGESNSEVIYATKAYKIASKLEKKQKLTERDKKLARDIIKSKLSKSKDLDSTVITLLQQCEEALK